MYFKFEVKKEGGAIWTKEIVLTSTFEAETAEDAQDKADRLLCCVLNDFNVREMDSDWRVTTFEGIIDNLTKSGTDPKLVEKLQQQIDDVDDKKKTPTYTKFATIDKCSTEYMATLSHDHTWRI